MALADLLRDLVTANRILANEGVVDAYGHISVRHPDRADRFFLSCSRSPELVAPDDIIEYDLDCNPIDLRGRAQYTERPIHGAIFGKRPDVMSVVHNHANEIIPFTVVRGVKLRPLLHVAAGIGADIPVWDIRDRFGDTNMLVTNLAQGSDLAEGLGANRVVLMRGHGSRGRRSDNPGCRPYFRLSQGECAIAGRGHAPVRRYRLSQRRRGRRDAEDQCRPRSRLGVLGAPRRDFRLVLTRIATSPSASRSATATRSRSRWPQPKPAPPHRFRRRHTDWHRLMIR